MNFTPHSVACFWLGWFAGCIVMSLVSGWWFLARKFPGKPAHGLRRYFVSGSVAQLAWLPMQYHATFFLTLDQDGIRLSVFFPVRLMHPPLYLPWTAITCVGTERFLWFFRQTLLELDDGKTRIRIRGRAGKDLLAQHRQVLTAASPAGAGLEAA